MVTAFSSSACVMLPVPPLSMLENISWAIVKGSEAAVELDEDELDVPVTPLNKACKAPSIELLVELPAVVEDVPPVDVLSPADSIW